MTVGLAVKGIKGISHAVRRRSNKSHNSGDSDDSSSGGDESDKYSDGGESASAPDGGSEEGGESS